MAKINQRQMKQAMKKMGISQSEVPNVTEVIIRTRDNETVITNAQVVCIDMNGAKSYQITGTEHSRGGHSSRRVPDGLRQGKGHRGPGGDGRTARRGHN